LKIFSRKERKEHIEKGILEYNRVFLFALSAFFAVKNWGLLELAPPKFCVFRGLEGGFSPEFICQSATGDIP
jgi:hypothetical protein